MKNTTLPDDVEMALKCGLVIAADYIVLRRELAVMSPNAAMQAGNERGANLGNEAYEKIQAVLRKHSTP
jgi:hypothetical protein